LDFSDPIELFFPRFFSPLTVGREIFFPLFSFFVFFHGLDLSHRGQFGVCSLFQNYSPFSCWAGPPSFMLLSLFFSTDFLVESFLSRVDMFFSYFGCKLVKRLTFSLVTSSPSLLNTFFFPFVRFFCPNMPFSPFPRPPKNPAVSASPPPPHRCAMPRLSFCRDLPLLLSFLAGFPLPVSPFVFL